MSQTKTHFSKYTSQSIFKKNVKYYPSFSQLFFSLSLFSSRFRKHTNTSKERYSLSLPAMNCINISISMITILPTCLLTCLCSWSQSVPMSMKCPDLFHYHSQSISLWRNGRTIFASILKSNCKNQTAFFSISINNRRVFRPRQNLSLQRGPFTRTIPTIPISPIFWSCLSEQGVVSAIFWIKLRIWNSIQHGIPVIERNIIFPLVFSSWFKSIGK